MTVEGFVAVVLSASAPILAVACTSCGEQQHSLPSPPPPPEGKSFATDGQVFTGPNSDAEALAASGAHDLSCPVAQVVLQQMVDEHGKAKHVVDGCGRRAFYFWNPVRAGLYTYDNHAVLENVLPLAPPAPT